MPPGFVWLVGAGPGDPGLLTVRAVECLRQADLVLYDRLVAPALLGHARASARRVCVDELASAHPDRWPLVNRMMVEAAKSGRRVVRLKGGDPMIFGRGGEEAEVLRAAGVDYEIVPGITAALGAASCAGISLTHRDHASAVCIVTGHESPGKPDSRIDWPALARFPGTLVFYMGIARLEVIAAALVGAGKAADTPAAVVQQATTPGQRVVSAPLADLPAAARTAGIEAPALLFIGEVVALRERIDWFSRRPLFGKTVLVTRPAHQADDMVRRIEVLGGRAVCLPAVTLAEPADWAPVDAAIGRLAETGWVVFTSVNGVHAFIGRLRKCGRDLRALGGVRLAAIGPATAEALRGYHLEPDVVPEEYNSEGLAAALRERVRGTRVLLARADRGIDLLRDELSAVAEVEQVAVYSQRDAVLEEHPEALAALRAGAIDYVTLTSSNIARVIGSALTGGVRGVKPALVCISPRTSAAVRELGLPVAAEATEYTTAGVLDAVCRLSAQVAEGVQREVEHDAAHDDAEDVHQEAAPAEGNPEDRVEQE